MKLLIINGPNMNMMGIREPEIYGSDTYEDLVELIKSKKSDGNELNFVQSNHEGVIIDAIQQAYYDGVEGIVINPAAYTHTSIAIADALRAVKIPCVEVHLSDVNAREDYRRISYVREIAIKTITGKGPAGYLEAISVLEENK